MIIFQKIAWVGFILSIDELLGKTNDPKLTIKRQKCGESSTFMAVHTPLFHFLGTNK